ncbi:MAG: coxM [Verrucomicrobiales bacterium]|nr:coxM [Verrucomicrobiales bacterium]
MTNSILNYFALPVDASAHGHGIDSLIIWVHVLMLALFVGWLGYFIYVLLRFNQKRNPKADYYGVKSHLSTYVEGIVALVEAVLLIGFAIPIWAKAVQEFPKEEDSKVIRIVAQQFQWNGRYPGKDGKFGAAGLQFLTDENKFGLDKNDPLGKDDFVATQTLTVPVDEPVICYISSLDVIHSFKIVPLRVTQDAIPGLVIPAHFTAKQIGEYNINCAQLCGNSHYGMKGYLKVVSKEDYAKWVTEQSKGGAATSFE